MTETGRVGTSSLAHRHSLIRRSSPSIPPRAIARANGIAHHSKPGVGDAIAAPDRDSSRGGVFRRVVTSAIGGE